MENERRDDPREQSQPAAEPHSHAGPPEPSYRDEDRRERGDFSEPREERGNDFDRPDEPYEQAPSSDEPPYESAEQGAAQEGGAPHEEGGPSTAPGPGGPGGPGGHGRGRRRGGRGRMSARDRRMQARDRRRDQQQPRRGSYGGAPSHGGGGAPREEDRRHSDLPPEQRSWILEAKAEVDRIRETLESVLNDLDHVSEQLTKAEHEKDIAETEIEQLRESLRRIHR